MWRDIAKDFDFADEASQSLLRMALEAHQRCRQCREAIEKDGQVVPDRFGHLKAHPLLSTERDARSAFLTAMRILNLDLSGVTR
ncbi:MAG: P27 family phage terminase small subunit [Caulobacteraceae bacterium]